MIPLAVAGNGPLAQVDASGYLYHDGVRLEWWVLGDDQWHAPAATSSLRQRCVDHTPVVETSIRVPGGDVVWRVGAAVGGVVIECENRAAIPVALGLARVNEVNEVRELEVFPVTHGTTWRRALDDYNDRDVPDLEAVVRGWQTLSGHGASVELNDPVLDDALATARVAVLVHQGALIETGKKADRATASAVNNALVLLGYEDEASDLRLACKLKPQRKGLALVPNVAAPMSIDADDVALLSDPLLAANTVEAIRNILVVDETEAIDVLPGFDATWRGRSVDVTGLPSAQGALSFALRWHGDNPALLWDAPGPITARSIDPSFASSESTGERLLRTTG